MTNINSGTAVLKEITSQNHWHVASMKTFICFARSLTHGQDGREGGGGSERVNKTREECEPFTGCEQKTQCEWEDGSRATTSESSKPVIAVADAKQDWGFLQYLEAKQIPHPGLKTDLVFSL